MTALAFDVTRIGQFAIHREIDIDTMTVTIVGIPDSAPEWLVNACEGAMNEAQNRNMSTTQRKTVVDYHPAQANVIGASAVFYQVIDGIPYYYYGAGVTTDGKVYSEVID